MVTVSGASAVPYWNSWFFQTYANSNKMSRLLHVQINECILY